MQWTHTVNLRRVHHWSPRAFFPSRFRSDILPGNFTSDKALSDISRFQVQMTVDRTDLAGDVEARDRLFHRVEHALLDVVFGAALGVIDNRPSFHDVEGRIGDWHHGFRR